MPEPTPEVVDDEFEKLVKIEIDYKTVAFTSPLKYQVSLFYNDGTVETDLWDKDSMVVDMCWKYFSSEDQLVLKPERDSYLARKSQQTINPNVFFQDSNAKGSDGIKANVEGMSFTRC